MPWYWALLVLLTFWVQAMRGSLDPELAMWEPPAVGMYEFTDWACKVFDCVDCHSVCCCLPKGGSRISSKQITMMVISVCLSCINLGYFAWATCIGLSTSLSSSCSPHITHHKFELSVWVDRARDMCKVVHKLLEANWVRVRISRLMMLIKSSLEFLIYFTLGAFMRFYIGVARGSEPRF